MNLHQLDEYIVSTPMSQKKRIEYLKVFIDKAYLKGIDRGTTLEHIRQEKIKKLHEKIITTKFKKLMDDIYDFIQTAENRVYREKYKGRYNYNYYIPKKKRQAKPRDYKPTELW